MSFVKARKWSFLISGLLILAGVISLLLQGLNLGIHFTGGTLIHMDLKEDYAMEDARGLLADFELEGTTLQRVGVNGEGRELIIKAPHLQEDERREIIDAFMAAYPAMTTNDVLQEGAVGAIIGDELAREAMIALLLAGVGMILYITVRFEFKFAVSAIAALLHDALIILTLFSFLQWEINNTFIAAILTVIGYSVNDSIVIIDRIRENNKLQRGRSMEEVVDDSIKQNLMRSINTSLTTLIVLVSLFTAFNYFIGGLDLQIFAMALLIGVISGTYSSIFIAAPLWYSWKEWEKKRKKRSKAA